jgi:ABC-type Na+ efflux pump permease subunit
MMNPVVGHLIRKDWRQNMPVLIISGVGGVIALAILQIGGTTPFVIGAAFYFISMMICASILPQTNIVNERKKQTLPFLISLPISTVQYGMAKLASTVGMFLILWLGLVGAALWLIAVRHALPGGAMPYTVILAILPFIGFCLITATALVAETEAWAAGATGVVNSSYWLVWYVMSTNFPELTRDWMSRTAVWNSTVFGILGVEGALIVLILGVTLYIQSRKRDFV